MRKRICGGQPVLLANARLPESERITTYLAHGGYRALRRSMAMTPEQIIEEVKASGLRGRGGAGYPTGLKWSSLPRNAPVKYLVVNCDEGEPGTFKDRLLVEHDPHALLEGVIIACYALDVARACIYVRGEFDMGVTRLGQAIAEAYEHGLLGRNVLGSGFALDVSVYRGAGAYVCGEETALLESLEGERGQPRLKPPYPTQAGLFNRPTLVQNVETLVNIPHIILRGAAWFAGIGTEQSRGPKIFCVSGHVNRRGAYELPLGTTLRELIYEHAGGVREGRAVKADIPGGTSTGMLGADKMDVPMAFETLQAAGSGLGTGGVIVMDESTDMVEVTRHIAGFYAHESCGQCAPCRLGSERMLEILTNITAGLGTIEDLDLLREYGGGMQRGSLCPLGQAAPLPVLSALNQFEDEFLARIPRAPARLL